MSESQEKTTTEQITIAPGDVRAAESVLMLKRLTAELAARYNDDGVGGFQPSYVDQPRSGFLVARLAGAAVGCGVYRPLEHDIGEVKRMYVDPDFRGRGIGRQLLAALEEKLVEAGFSKVRLEAGTSQPEALRLYQSMGYRRIAPYGFYREDPRSVCFEKVLI